MRSMLRRVRQDQSGVAMVTAILAIFILTVVVASLTVATMGETTLSFDQSRAGQAIHLAEAGTYRALAELRRRLANDLDANVRAADPLIVQGYCSSNRGWYIISNYGGPGWQNDATNRRAYLELGTAGVPVEVRDGSGNVVGSFYATIYVRASDNRSGPANGSNICITSGVQSYQFWYDYFIVATGATRNAQRTVCLKNPGNQANCGEWVASAGPGTPNPGDTVFDTAPADHGFKILIEMASYSRWALMLLNASGTWLTSTATFLGPAHTNSSFNIWGNPTFGSSVSQVGGQVYFGNGGNPQWMSADSNPPEDQPVYQSTRLQMNAGSIGAPAGSSPFWAVLDQNSTGSPANNDVRARTTALSNGNTAVPSGIYFMDECGNPVCGGIFVQGNAPNVVLAVEGGKQAIYVTASGGQSKKYVLESSTNTRECTGPPGFATCTNMGKGFNGMVFVNGNITRSAGNPNTGLYGTVQQDTRLTIAADGEIFVTDHVVYEAPPTGPNDPIQNVLGLYSWCAAPPVCTNRNVTVDGALAPNDLYVDASVLAPWGQFWVRGWDTLSNRGTLRFLGGTVQSDFGPWGGFNVDAFGNITGYTGYSREMTFDQRFLTNNAPPFFPLTNQFTAPRYPRLNPDPLYDRPLWEEITAP